MFLISWRIFDIMINVWCIFKNFLTSWHVFDFITNYWRYDQLFYVILSNDEPFVIIWHVFDIMKNFLAFLSDDELFDLMTCFDVIANSLTSWHVFDFMKTLDLFLTSWQTFWRHDDVLSIFFWPHNMFLDINVFMYFSTL